MGIIAWLLIGLIAGSLARWIMPGREPGGCLITILLGIAGAFVGGFLAVALDISDEGVDDFDIGTIVLATIGAMIILFVYRLLNGRRRY
jgi:uncharacterized membrane protein YeaQ/YmgE (transglycosylase-associated protein family)